MHNHFRIAGGPEDMSAFLQLRPQFDVVVDFAIRDEPHALVFVGERLTTAGQVDQAEPAVSEATTVAEIESVAIGSSMAERRGHSPDEFLFDRLTRPRRVARNPAHVRPALSHFHSFRAALSDNQWVTALPLAASSGASPSFNQPEGGWRNSNGGWRVYCRRGVRLGMFLIDLSTQRGAGATAWLGFVTVAIGS